MVASVGNTTELEWRQDSVLDDHPVAAAWQIDRRLLGRSMAYSMLVGTVERCHREDARLEIRSVARALNSQRHR